MTPKQKKAHTRNSAIRMLCGIYAQVNGACLYWAFSRVERTAITEAIDTVLERIRGESETAKRERERIK